ncbi:hypothetical protein NPIL_208021 [Nephila pilipes]|uniref:Uncharacterized protein n=1 Tax=Nephila pilipes TaxID=299642 RepID=A0A8X6N0T2_NEPPI|nr:hypothetical protein NPIL_208021 [Nephila pilipes]
MLDYKKILIVGPDPGTKSYRRKTKKKKAAKVSIACQTGFDEEDSHQRTLAETILPWRCNNDCRNESSKPQEEFPAWVENREYYPGYLDPTPIYMESARYHYHRESYSESINQLSDLEDDCFESPDSESDYENRDEETKL